MTKKLFLLDAMALIFRAYYAMIKSPRVTTGGLNTSAILGFTNTLYDVLKTEKPTHIAVSFDTGAPTLRHADFDQYKAHRESTPDDIVTSIPYIKKILDAFNIPTIILDGYEADDIIGTAAKKAEIEGFQVYMMTSDKDYGQLVSENIFMYKPGKFGQKAEVVGVKEICEKYGIRQPEQLIDILGLWGDASDNIPGVPGIGEVKAKRLIAQFGSIEMIYKRIEEVDNDKLRQTLLDYKDQAFMSKMLATIMLDVPVELDFKSMKYRGPDEHTLREVFKELEFKALTQRVFKDLGIALSEKGSANASAPDLFSNPVARIDSQEDSDEEHFDCFNDADHHFHEIKNLEDLTVTLTPSATIFFDWILWEGKISGFAFSVDGTHEVFYHFLESEYRAYKELLQALFQNGNTVVSYQCKQTFKYFHHLKIQPGVIFFDLQVAHYLIQPENAHQLERLSEQYLHYSMITPVNKKELSLFPDPDQVTGASLFTPLVQAACERIEVYRKLYPVFQREMEMDNLTTLFDRIEMPLVQVLADMEYTGVKLDVSMLEESSEALNHDLEGLEGEIFRLAGSTFNLASPKQLGEILFNKLRIIENAKLTKTKQYQTGEEVLNKLVNKHPIIPLILEWRMLSKLKTTYIDALPLLIDSKTGKIHTTFNQTVTSTGRLSSVNPNLQNIPIRTERGKDIRKAFVASDENSLIVSADYSQIELRIVAAICKDERMIEAFKSGRDIHTAMAAQIYNVPITEVTQLMRRNAKTVNFGILYGMSAFGLADRLHIPQKEARELIENYFSSFPKIDEYLDNTLQFARDKGYVETLFGRRRYIRDINSANGILRKASERNAINAPIQGTAADLIKLAMIRIYNALKERKLKSKMILQVHDELVFDVPMEELEEVKKVVVDLMTHVLDLNVPLSVEISEGKNWFQAH